MTRTLHNRWLRNFAVLTAVATLVLISVGGLVTSKGVGMAVPDWPTTYGYNMFLFPISKWVGGIFWEHSHRLIASGVGFMTIILAIWIWVKDERAWMRWLGVGALLLVCLQGLLGGLRVTLYKDEIGIFHATLAQLFLVLVAAMGLFLSRWWIELETRARSSPPLPRRFTAAALALVLATLAQLVIAATMRHQHAGLAVPDFPLAHGRIYPPTDQEFLDQINQKRLDTRDFHPVQAFHIHLHMAHRGMAALLLVGIPAMSVWAARAGLGGAAVGGLSKWWAGLIFSQFLLGVFTVWSNKAADIATAHVVVGAATLVTGSFLWLIARKSARAQRAVRPSGPPETTPPPRNAPVEPHLVSL